MKAARTGSGSALGSRAVPVDLQVRGKPRGRAVEPAREVRPSDTRLARDIAAWFKASARDLPWRTTPRDPYRSLVSEFMLQQTQVSRVLEKFGAFVREFPTARALAQADDRDVLASWAGLGYYRRAKLLHAAGKCIVSEFDGEVPADVSALRSIPGIGRYTAGAIASIVFGHAEPIVDGNVLRVLSRVRGKDGAADEPELPGWAWGEAERLVKSAESPALFNEGLMELGATVCVPRAPRCSECPARRGCVAFATGRQDELPRPKQAPRRDVVHHATVLVRDGRGRVLMEQRPGTGMWASMWQAPTYEKPAGRSGRAVTRGDVLGWLGAGDERPLRLVGRFVYPTSHREFRVSMWDAGVWKASDRMNERWGTAEFVSVSRLESRAISNLQRRILLAGGVRVARGAPA